MKARPRENPIVEKDRGKKGQEQPHMRYEMFLGSTTCL